MADSEQRIDSMITKQLIFLRDNLTFDQCRDFVRHMTLTEVDIDTVKHDFTGAEEQKYQLLRMVVKHKGQDSHTKFEDTLIEMGLRSVAEDFTKYKESHSLTNYVPTESQASSTMTGSSGFDRKEFKEGSVSKAKCHGVDLLIREYVDRPAEIDEILQLIDRAESAPVGIIDAKRQDQYEYQSTPIGIKGLGGIGKTTIAKAIAQRVCRELNMEVFWLTISQKSDILRSFNTLKFYFSGKKESFPDVKAGQEWLRESTKDKQILLILDDVWNETDVIPFNVLGPKCKLLLTTRNDNVISFNKARSFKLGGLSIEQSREMLLRYTGMDANKIRELHLGQMFKEFQNILKDHPLAIALIGSVLRQFSSSKDVSNRWKRTLQKLSKRNAFWEQKVNKLRTESYSYSLNGAFDVSFNFLGSDEESEEDEMLQDKLTRLQRRFLDFALFPEDTAIPGHVLKKFWSHENSLTSSNDNSDAESDGDDDGDDDDDDYLDDDLYALKESSLVNDVKSDSDECCYGVHDLVLQYAEYKFNKMLGKGSFQRRQEAFLHCYTISLNCVEAEEATCPPKSAVHSVSDVTYQPKNRQVETKTTGIVTPWWKINNDGYIYQHLMHHLLKAGDEQIAGKLLIEYEWIKRKLRETDIAAVISDFELYFKHFKSLKKAIEDCVVMLYETLNFTARIISKDKDQLPYQLLGSLVEIEEPSVQILVSKMKIDETVNRKYSLVPLTSSLTQPGGYLKRSIPDNKATVLCVAFTHDNKRIIAGLGTGGYKKARILVVDRATGREAVLGKECDHHEGLVFGLAIHPKDYFVITASFDMTLKVWPLDDDFESVHTLTGHDDNVFCVTLSADGSFAVSGSADKTIRKWDMLKKECTLTMKGHHKTIRQVCITSKSDQVVSGSEDETIRVWCLNSGQQLRQFDSRVKFIYQIAITHDDERVIAVGINESAIVMNLNNGNLITELKGHGCEIIACAVTNNDSHVFTGAADGKIRMWSLMTYKEERLFQGHAERVRYIGISKDRKAMASGSEDCSLKLWDCDPDHTKQVLIQRGHGKAVSALVVKAEGNMILSASLDFTVQLWELSTFSCVHTFHGHIDSVNCLAISQELGYGLSGSDDKTINVWDLDRRENVCSPLLGHEYGITALKAARFHERNIMVSGSIDNTLILWNLDECIPLCKLISEFYDVKDIAVNCNKIVASFGDSVSQWTITKDKVDKILSNVFTRDDEGDPASCQKSSKGDFSVQSESGFSLMLSEEYEADISVVSKQLYTFPIVEKVNRNGYVVGWDEVSRIRLWDLNNEMESKISSGHEDNDLVTSLYLTPDNEILLCGSEKGHVNLIGLNNTESYIGKLKRQLQLNSSVTSIFLLESEFVCDDKTYSVLMFAGFDNGLISWWNTNNRTGIYGCGRTPFSSIDPKQLLESESSAKLLEIDGEQEIGRVESCVSQLVGYFQDTNPMLLSTCKSDEDISITIWNVIKGQQVKKLSGHKGPVTALCFVEPTVLLSASLDGTVRCWNVQTGTCSRVDESNFGSKCGIKCLTVFPNKESYLIGSRNNVMEEHELETGEKVGRDIQLGPRFNMKHLAVSHDSRTVTCCYDNYFSEIREKDNGEYKVILSMMGHQNEWGNISKFGEDGHTVLSGTTHCRLKAWDTNNGHTLAYVGRCAVQSKQQLEEERKIESHTRMVTSVKMHKERFILTGSYDKSIKVWKIEKNEDSVGLTYHVQSTFFFEHAVTSVDVTKDDVVCVGLLNGLICFLELRDTCFKQ